MTESSSLQQVEEPRVIESEFSSIGSIEVGSHPGLIRGSDYHDEVISLDDLLRVCGIHELSDPDVQQGVLYSSDD